MLDGMGIETPVARQRVLAGKQSGEAIDDAAEALGRGAGGLRGDLARLQRSAPPIGLVQVARYADPHNSSGTVAPRVAARRAGPQPTKR